MEDALMFIRANEFFTRKNHIDFKVEKAAMQRRLHVFLCLDTRDWHEGNPTLDFLVLDFRNRAICMIFSKEN
jgi:hypothetical protein